MQIEELKSELEKLNKSIKVLLSKNMNDEVGIVNERIAELEAEINKHLDLIEEVEVDKNGEERTSYFLKKNGRTVKLNDLIDFEINEISGLYNDDDLVFINAENSGYDVWGIFSFDKNKIIFPFIIEDSPVLDDNNFIYLFLNESLANNDWDLVNMGGNPDGVHCYLNKDGSFFQNEGKIEEKISSSLYLLNDGNSTLKLYDCNSESDNHIVLSDINSCEHSEFNLLSLETTDSVGLYDLLKNELFFLNKGISSIEIINNNFFTLSFSKFKKVINRNGKTLLAYSLLSETYQEIIEVTKNENHYIDKEREYYELNLQNEFYRVEKDGIIFNNDSITITAVDLLRKTKVSITIGYAGEVEISDILTPSQKAAEYLLIMPLLTYQQASEQQKKNNPEAFRK